MEKRVNNIDDFFKHELDGFQVPAPPEAWDAIVGQVQKNDRKLIPVFWRWAAAVAILLGSTFALNNFLTDSMQQSLSENESIENLPVNVKSTTSQPVNVDEEDDTKNIDSSTLLLQKGNANPHSTSNKNAKTSHTDNTTKENNQDQMGSAGITGSDVPRYGKTKQLLAENKIDHFSVIPEEKHTEIEHGTSVPNTRFENVNPQVGDNGIVEELQSVVIAENNADSEGTQITEKENEKPKEFELPKDIHLTKEKHRGWAIGGGVSPMYSFRDLHQNSQDRSYQWQGGESNESNEQAVIAFSGGVDVEYQTNRWSFSSGVYYSQNGMETENFNFNRLIVYTNATQTNIYASSSAGDMAYEEISQTELGEIVGSNNIDGEPYSPGILNSDPVESDATLRQDFEYLEIPFIAKYKLIDRKIDVQFLAGLSTSFLLENTNKLEYSGNELDMGEIENLRKINYNSLVGFGFQYPFSKQINFRLQPMFRYALRPLNEDYSVSNFPYSFAVYTGFAFEF